MRLSSSFFSEEAIDVSLIFAKLIRIFCEWKGPLKLMHLYTTHCFQRRLFFPGTALSTSLSRSTRSALYLDETLVDFPSFTKIMYNHVWKRKDVACKKTWFFLNWPWLILYIQLNNFPRQCLIWAYSFISDRLSDIEPAIFFYDCVAKQRFASVKPVDHVFSVIEF